MTYHDYGDKVMFWQLTKNLINPMLKIDLCFMDVK